MLLKAALKGHDDSQFYLGTMYRKGDGLKQDKAEALRWYRSAANDGHKIAQFNLGIMYYSGDGIPQNKPQALIWLKKSANQGYAKAEKLLKQIGQTNRN